MTKMAKVAGVTSCVFCATLSATMFLLCYAYSKVLLVPGVGFFAATLLILWLLKQEWKS